MEAHLLRGLINPFGWFDDEGRTELAVEYYEEVLFGGATFADMIQEDRPLMLINAVTDVQLHRYNAATRELIKQELASWAKELSTRDTPVMPYFIELNRVPTSFSLTDEQVDRLIVAGHELLRDNPEFRRLITDLGGRIAGPKPGGSAE